MADVILVQEVIATEVIVDEGGEATRRAAVEAAIIATTKANEASESATISTVKAGEASAAASTAFEKATEAALSADSANDKAATATTKAAEASASAEAAHISEVNAANSFAAATIAAGVTAWNATTSYSFPQVVAYTDGHSYRCTGTNIVGEIPNIGGNWTRVTVGLTDVFDYDESGDMMPAVTPVYSDYYTLDGDGDIMPR